MSWKSARNIGQHLASHCCAGMLSSGFVIDRCQLMESGVLSIKDVEKVVQTERQQHDAVLLRNRASTFSQRANPDAGGGQSRKAGETLSPSRRGDAPVTSPEVTVRGCGHWQQIGSCK